MFGKLQGVIDYIGNGFVILMAGGVGFRIMLPANVLTAQTVGDKATFWIETIVRDDAINLVGFDSLAAENMFVKLISVSGVGPKVALAILGAFKTDVLENAIAGGDIGTLTEVPGIGKKVAERLIVELKGKVVASAGIAGGEGRGAYNDALAALEALGYRRVHTVELVQRLIKEKPDDDIQSLITKALKELSS